MTDRTLIIGIGNFLMTDDAAGVHAVNALKDLYDFPEGVELLDGGTMSLDLLPYIEDCQRLMLLDAVNFDAPSGTVRVIEGRDMKAFLDLKFSVHQIALPDMLFALDFKGIKPPEMCLVGIQPRSLETGIEMTGEVAENFGVFLDAILERLSMWGITAREKNPAIMKSEYRYVPGHTL